MRTAAGFLVIWGVILAVYVSLAIAGVVGASTAGLVMRARDAEWARSTRWVGVAAVTGVASGMATAFVVFVGAALFGWSMAGLGLPFICWSAAAVSAAVVRACTLRRRRRAHPQGKPAGSAV